MKSLFDKRFVHFMWDDELEGKEGFFADSISGLQSYVELNKEEMFGDVKKSSRDDSPFVLLKDSDSFCSSCRFFYADPNYEFKRAYAEGKQLQLSYDGTLWVDIESDWEISDFDTTPAEFRIKPEEPKSRPFEDTAELILHYQQHFNVVCPPYAEPLIWIKDKDDDRYLIKRYSEECVFVDTLCLTMKELFEDYVFLDGSPCGIKE